MISVAKKPKGFTLIEMVVTITVLAIVMAGTLVYITNSMTAYTATVRRDKLTSLGRTAVEQVAQDLRGALPNSLRVSNHCIEFFPTLGGSRYLTLPLAIAATTFTAVDFTTDSYSGNAYVAVYPYNTANLYAAADPGPLAAYSSKSGNPTATITLTAAHEFSHQAPYRRFYLVGEPVSYCVVGTDLMRYSQYGINPVQTTPPTTGSSVLMAQHIQISDSGNTVTPFTYSPGTLQRSGVVTLDFRFLIDGEWIRLAHEVHIHNVL